MVDDGLRTDEVQSISSSSVCSSLYASRGTGTVPDEEAAIVNVVVIVVVLVARPSSCDKSELDIQPTSESVGLS